MSCRSCFFALVASGAVTLILSTRSVANPPTLAWARGFDGYAHDFEIAVAVVLDPDGNIYVTGSRNNSEFLTMKLDPSGNVIWTARAPFDSNSYASPTAIIRDNAGNI